MRVYKIYYRHNIKVPIFLKFKEIRLIVSIRKQAKSIPANYSAAHSMKIVENHASWLGVVFFGTGIATFQLRTGEDYLTTRLRKPI